MRISDWSSDECSSDLGRSHLSNVQDALDTGWISDDVPLDTIQRVGVHIMRRYTHGPAIRAVDSCARSGQISAHAAGQAWQKPADAHVGEEANACFRHGESCPLRRDAIPRRKRSAEHTSDHQSLMRISYAD